MARNKKKAEIENRTIVFADESGFYLLPFIAKTFAPKSQTPILRKKLSREHLSVMSGITISGRLYVQIQEKAFKGSDVVEYLRHLLRHINGNILLVWDGCPIHKSKEVKKFLCEENMGRIHIEQLPAYSPELNPDEGIWQYLKCVLLRNVCCMDLDTLKKKIRKAIRTLRTRKQHIIACFSKAGCV